MAVIALKPLTAAIVAVLLISSLAGCASVTDKAPPEIAGHLTEWPTANHDYSNARVARSNITRGNVSGLAPAWSVDLTGIGEWGGMASNPIITGDAVYFQDLKSNVYAVDLNTGALRWKKQYDLDAFGPNGPVAGWGKLFVTKGHFEIVALDIADGAELWSTKLPGIPSVGIDIQPVAYNGLLFTSTVAGTSNEDFNAGGGVGVLYALDQQTGQIRWQFNTVDSKDIWGNPNVNSGGGAWYPPAIDPSTGIMYWAITNGGPIPGTDEFPGGTSRPGPNLYTNSMVALESATGRLLWYSQVKAHDLFDLDFQSSPVLASASITGQSRDVVIGTGKVGKVLAFDRKSGEILWQTPVGPHQNDELQELPDGVTRVSPGPDGGILTPIALAEGKAFLPLIDCPGDYTPTEFVESTYDINKGKGFVVALDINTGKPVWTTQLGAVNCGGATVLNDLVFTSTLDGKIYALDARTGDIIWTYQAQGGINGWPAAAGDFILFPVGLGQSPKLIALRVRGGG